MSSSLPAGPGQSVGPDPALHDLTPAPTPEQRLAVRRIPELTAAGRQRWRDLLFLHWRVPAAAVQATLPPGLTVDTYADEAYIGIVPFFMERVRLSWLPPVPGISWFKELNVRTYVHDADGKPGVWFYSLDCDQPLAVWIARRLFYLPYFHAQMRSAGSGAEIEYRSQRRHSPGGPDRYVWTTTPGGASAVAGSLDDFLVERYILYSVDRAGRLMEGQVHHDPYKVYTPRISTFSSGPARHAGFELDGAPASVLAANLIDVTIYPIRPNPRDSHQASEPVAR